MQVHRYLPAVAAGPVALTLGNFDGVHLGHQAMLERTVTAARHLGIPSWALTFEPHPREFFAPDRAPARLTALRDKLTWIRQSGIEHAQVCRFDYTFAQISAVDFIERVLLQRLAVRWLLVGEDFRFGARRTGDLTLLKLLAQKYGYAVEVLPSVQVDGVRVSSTAVRAALAEGDMARAQQLLGRPYRVSGRVVRNDQLGRTLGFPTANILLKHNRPALKGIYAVEVQGISEQPWLGVASLGVRPTIGRNLRPALEVHLLDFDRDLYGAHLSLDFLHKFRDEEKYADVETLKRQIACDVENAREFFFRRDAERRRKTKS